MLDVFNQAADFGVLRIDVGSLVRTGKKSGLPVFTILDRQSAGTHGNEAGQIPIFGAQAVQQPGTHARSALHRIATVHQHQ